MTHLPNATHLLLTALDVVVSAVASAHVVLYKRETRSAIGWIGLIWLSPFVGTIAYILLGINRINRKARSLRRNRPIPGPPKALACTPEQLRDGLLSEGAHLASLARLVGEVAGRPLLGGNRVVPLHGGDQAYPEMFAAIDGATRSVSLTTYIFNDDRAGGPFAEALRRAMDRGAEVRVIVDGIGVRYGWPPITRSLARLGIPHALFLPTLVPWFLPFFNLRSHRKILVVDGRLGFTGGMNIYEDYRHDLHPKHPKDDLHFRVEGPVVASLQRVFAEDWAFCRRELLHGEAWFPHHELAGPTLAREITDGPDDDQDGLMATIQGALACAERSVAIVTPYFLPGAAIISALNVAAMRGVEVDIFLPAANNLRVVGWAMMAILDQVLERGCRVWFTPPPFDHTKLMIVDGTWVMFGSANWDPRSLRLNFEVNLECYDPALARRLEPEIERRRRSAHLVTRKEMAARPLPIKLRDGVARLFSPYL